MSAIKRTSPPPETMDSSSVPTRKILDAKLPSRKRTTLGKMSSNSTQPTTSTSKPPPKTSPESSEAEVSEDEIPYIRPQNARPVMRVSTVNGFGEGLNNLPDFLKQMKEANEELMKKISGGEERGLEDVKEGESYVEMNLGLGVLEEKKEGESESESESESQSESQSGSESGSESEAEEEDADGDRKMGERKKAGIEEL